MEPRPPLSGLARLAADPRGDRAGGGDRAPSVPAAGSGGAEIVASPIGRARRTAEIIAECLTSSRPSPADPLRRTAARDLARLLGRARPSARSGTAPRNSSTGEEGRWEYYFRSPDGETYEAFAGRIAGFLADLGDAPVIAVTHGVVTRVLRGLYAGLPRDEALRLAVPQDRVFRLSGGTIAEIRPDTRPRTDNPLPSGRRLGPQ